MISLRELKLKNFLSHRETTIPFTDETFVIIGHNASGKTSILRGIFFALFGEDLEGRKVKRENLINRTSNSARLSLTFISKGNRYRVERVISVRKNEARLFKGDTLVAERTKEVSRFLSENLGLEPNTLKNTIFVPQGEITELFKGTPKERRQILNRLLGLEEFGKKYEALNLKLKELRNIKGFLEEKVLEGERLKEKESKLIELLREKEEERKKLSEEKRKVEERLKELKEKLSKLEEERNLYLRLSETKERLEREIEKLSEEEVSVKKKLKELEGVRERIAILERETEPIEKVKNLLEILRKVRNLRREIEIREGELKDIKEKERRLGELKELLPKLREREGVLKEEECALNNRLREKKEELTRAEQVLKYLNELSKELKKVNERIEAFGEVKLEEIERKLKEVEKELEETRNLKAEVGEKLKELKERGELLKESSEAECPVCRRPLSEEEREGILNRMREEFKSLRERFKGLKERESQLKREIEILRKALREESLKSERLKGFKERKGEVESKLEKLKGELPSEPLEKLKEEVESLEKEWERVRKELNEVQGEVRALKREEEQIERNLKNRSSKDLEKDISNLKEELKTLEEEWGDRLNHDLHKVEKKYEELLRKEREKNKLEGELKNETFLKDRLKKLSRERKEKEEELEQIGKKIGGIDFNEDYYKLLEENVKQKEEEKEDLISEISRISGEIKQIEKQVEELKGEMEEVEREKRGLLKLRDSLLILEKLSQTVHPEKGFLTLVRKRLLPQIEKHAKELFELFGFEFSRIKVDEDLSIKVVVPSMGEMSLEELSGGQQIAFALALRFAMAKQFSKMSLKTLILDEPTIHLDRERRIALTELLMKLKGTIPQMVIVTHDQELEVVADRVIKLRKVGGFSEVEID